jgi:hypothetical protein
MHRNSLPRLQKRVDTEEQVPSEVIISDATFEDANASPEIPQASGSGALSIPRTHFISSGLLKGLENEEAEDSSLQHPPDLNPLGKETAKFYEDVTKKQKRKQASSSSGLRRSKRRLAASTPPAEPIITIEDEDNGNAGNSRNNPVLVDQVTRQSAAQSTRRQKNTKKQFCNTCQEFFTTSLSDHLVSTVHQFSLQNPVKKSYVIPPSNTGYKMLKIAGWDEEQGLGKHNQGERDPVKTRLKPDRLGLGNESPFPLQVSHSKELKKQLEEETAKRRGGGGGFQRKSERLEGQRKERVKEFVVRDALYRELPKSLVSE